MVCVASSPTLLLEVPFVVRDFDVRDLGGIKRYADMAANLTDKLALNNGDVSNDPAISERDIHDLVGHAGLGLFLEKLAPMFWKTRLQHLTMIRRRSVSSISAFHQQTFPIKRKHEFLVIRAGRREQV